jgi:signal transduction histidine kinase
VLTSTLDYEETLENVARLAVRDLADFCIVDVLDGERERKRLKVMSRDPSKADVCDLFMQIKVAPDHPSLVAPVLRTKQTAIYPHLSPEDFGSFSEDAARAFRAADLRSVIAAPLLAHGSLVGVITLISSSRSPVYGPPQIRVAEELAQRAALSIQNARLFAEAQRAIKTREEVLAIVSHDLKNPLSTIQLLVDLFGGFETIDLPQVREFAGKVQRSADQMGTLINDLLDFARIQSGSFSVVVTPDKLYDVLMPVIDGIRTQADARQQKLEVDLPSTLPDVSIDANRIAQVVSNLLRNAIKFTPEKGVIRISARQQDHQVVVSVTDTGPGIPQENLTRIFDRFWQAPDARHKGSGLGLSIARGIVEAHHGTIWAESQPGKGSSFFFKLPVAVTDSMKLVDTAA